MKTDKNLETRGIVLRTHPLPKRDSIIHLFTEEDGLLKVIVPRSTGLRSRFRAAACPLVEAQWIVSAGKDDLHRAQDVSIVSHHHELRDALETLEIAGRLAQAIYRSQMLWKPAPLLYRLFTLYLQALPSFSCRATLELSFYAKLLKHEGLLSPNSEQPLLDWTLSPEQSALFMHCADSRSMHTLSTLQAPKNFCNEVHQYLIDSGVMKELNAVGKT